MTKQINFEWIDELMRYDRQDSTTDRHENERSNIDWVTNGKSFKKDLLFKVMPANSKENQIWVSVVGTHWNLGPNNKRFLCPEKTLHLRKEGIECPICAAKRKLIARGFTEQDLSVQGKFGPICVFDPIITSNMKVVVISSDLKSDWDKSHVSVLQQKGPFLSKWLASTYSRQDIPDFLALESSNLLRFSRMQENSKWEREVTFNVQNFTPDVVEKLRKENEELTLNDLWKMPSDQDILEVKQIVANMVRDYEEAKSKMTETSQQIVDDNIPF